MITSQCEGCVGISDDIVICGTTKEEHDACLLQFFKVAQNVGLALNSSKCVIKTNKITFFGRIYTDKGILPDPFKVEDIKNMKTPQDKEDLQRLLGMVTYVSCHLPNLSNQTKILRDLLKQETPFE